MSNRVFNEVLVGRKRKKRFLLYNYYLIRQSTISQGFVLDPLNLDTHLKKLQFYRPFDEEERFRYIL